MINKIFNADVLSDKGLARLPDQSVHCIVTSPPYFGLRDYGVEGQIGLEETPDQYVQKLVHVFREARRVLRDDGTVWLNLGDSYASSSKNRTEDQAIKNSTLQGSLKTQSQILKQQSKIVSGLKPKDLIGIPWRVAFALQADGWYLRQDIVWAKPNPMPESVTDRCTKSHEYIFLLSKSQRYYYDHVAIMQDVKMSSVERLMQDVENQEGNMKAKASWNGSSFDKGKTGEMMATRGGLRKSGNKERKDRPGAPENNGAHQKGSVPWEGMKANKRSVWTVTTKPFKEAHFATFPEDLIVDCIKAGCPEDGIVLDPFMGAGTTALVARKLNRNYVGFELNRSYIEIAEKRLQKELGMFV